MGIELGFAGHIVSQNGIRPDDNKYKAIKEFPASKNLLGLANQLAAFVPDLPHMSAGLRPLLKKGNAWVWEKEHKGRIQQDKEFADLTNNCKAVWRHKRYNTADRRIQITQTWIHASTEKQDGRMIADSVRISVTDTGATALRNNRLECLAIVWAIQKCDY